MKKQQYLSDLVRLLTVEQITDSAKHPTRYMSQMHIKLHYVALRRLGAL